MNKPLSGQKIAILVANGFDEVDMTHTQRALSALGATLNIISTENGLVNSWTGTAWGHHFPTDSHVSIMLAADYAALFVPGGSRSVTKLKDNAHCRRIMRGFFDAGKPMMLLGCAVELLAVSERAKGCNVTGDASSETIMTEAGAVWSNETPCVHSFLATATGNDAENPVYDLMEEFFAQEAEIHQQAA